jgi:hypothetical protein
MSGLHLFGAFGIELEYMLIDAHSLDVSASADKVLAALNGGPYCSDFAMGDSTWSNELALHVLELKTTQPARDYAQVARDFRLATVEMQKTLAPLGFQMLPTAMHPWMDPETQTKLWPHENREIYETYDRVFQCRSHGWANVQSVHLNLPFDGDEEFARLHAAVRILLPILPALAASSPIVDSSRTGRHDNRMHFYEHHCDLVPSMVGNVIPEPVYAKADYAREIFEPILQDIAPHDPGHLMDHEFLNARGAIARFDRGSIEVRVLDVQEYPLADIAICGLVTTLAKMLTEETWSRLSVQKAVSTDSLKRILDSCVVSGEFAEIKDTDYLRQFGIDAATLDAMALWRYLIDAAMKEASLLTRVAEPLELFARCGSLSTRILTALGSTFDQADLRRVYRELAHSLADWKAFEPT